MAVTLPEEVHERELGWSKEHWLRHCEGYCVYGPAGELGYVEEVFLSPDAEVEALVVRGAEQVTVPAEFVEDIEPRAERLWIREVPR